MNSNRHDHPTEKDSHAFSKAIDSVSVLCCLSNQSNRVRETLTQVRGLYPELITNHELRIIWVNFILKEQR